MRAVVLMSVVGVVVCAGVLAGPINLLAGPVTSTLKPLAEVEPRVVPTAANAPGDADSTLRIVSSGSYYLTADVFAVAGKSGIEIDGAENVTIDLNGFTVMGGPTSLAGVRTIGFIGGTTLHIRNGAVARCGAVGVDVYAQTMSVEGVSAQDCVGAGFRVQGNAATVTNCRAYRNGAEGFRMEATGSVTGCVAESSTGDGFFTSSGVKFSGCVSRFSGGRGFAIGTGSLIADCTVAVSTGDGIGGAAENTIVRNSVQAAGAGAGNAAGIHVTGAGNRIEENHVLTSDRGIDVDIAPNVIVKNTAKGNTLNYDISSPATNYVGTIVATPAGVASAPAWANFDVP